MDKLTGGQIYWLIIIGVLVLMLLATHTINAIRDVKRNDSDNWRDIRLAELQTEQGEQDADQADVPNMVRALETERRTHRQYPPK